MIGPGDVRGQGQSSINLNELWRNPTTQPRKFVLHQCPGQLSLHHTNQIRPSQDNVCCPLSLSLNTQDLEPKPKSEASSLMGRHLHGMVWSEPLV